MKIVAIDNTSEQAVSHNPKIKKHVLISNGEIKHITNFSEAFFPPGEIAYAHNHIDMTEVFFIKSGSGILIVDDKNILLTENMCITIEPGESHEIQNTGSKELIIMCLGIQS